MTMRRGVPEELMGMVSPEGELLPRMANPACYARPLNGAFATGVKLWIGTAAPFLLLIVILILIVIGYPNCDYD